MNNSARKTEFQGQAYTPFWSAVMLSERAQGKARDLEILYAGFPSAFTQSLAGLLDSTRREQLSDRIQVVEIISYDAMPQGIRMSHKCSPEGLLICDIWTPLQPALF